MLALFLTVFIDLLGFGLFLPSLVYWASAHQASEAQIGLLQASYSLAQFVCAPIWGRLSDRFGRRPVMLISIAGTGVAYLAFGFGGPLWSLFAARTAAGIFAGNIGTAQAYVADITTPENRAKGMGMLGAAFGLGFTFGPPLGGEIAGTSHFERPALFAAALCLINFALAAWSLPESHAGLHVTKPRTSRLNALASALTNARLSALIVLFFVVTFAFANMEQALILATRKLFQWSPRENGHLLGAVGILVIVMQGGLIGPLTKRFGERRLLFAGTLAMAGALAGLAAARTPSGYWLSMVPLALGNGLANPSLSTLLSKVSDPAERGQTLGLGQSASSLGRILAPIWAGWSFQHVAYSAPFATGAAVMLVAAALAWVLPAAVALAAETAPGP